MTKKQIIIYFIIIIIILLCVIFSYHQELKHKNNLLDNIKVYQLYYKDSNKLDTNTYLLDFGEWDGRNIAYTSLDDIYIFHKVKELKQINYLK